MEKQTFTLIGSVDGVNVDMEQPITKNQINLLDCQMLAEQHNATSGMYKTIRLMNKFYNKNVR